MQSRKIIAYKVCFEGGLNPLCVDSLDTALEVVKNEVETCVENENFEMFTICPYWTTREELDNLPEHDGDFN